MSDLFLVSGDLSFPEGELAPWRTTPLDDDAVGPLPEHVSPLSAAQAASSVGELLDLLRGLEGHAHIALEVGEDRFRLRAIVDDHALHDLGAPLAGAFRVARQLGAGGELVIALDSTPPSLVYRLALASDDGLVKLGARAARVVADHPGIRELRSMLDAPLSVPPPEAAPAPEKTKAKAPKPVPHRAPVVTAPIESLDDAELMQTFTHRVLHDPRAFYDEVGPLLDGDALADAAREPILRAISLVLGNNLIALPGTMGTGDILREDPRWADLLGRIVADTRVHEHFREGAFQALAESGDRRWIPLLAENTDVADAMTLHNSVLALGDEALEAFRERLDAEKLEELEVWLEDSKKTPARKVPSKKTPAKKAAVKQTVAKKAAAKKTPARKAAAKKAPSKKTPAKKPAAKKAPSKKTSRR